MVGRHFCEFPVMSMNCPNGVRKGGGEERRGEGRSKQGRRVRQELRKPEPAEILGRAGALLEHRWQVMPKTALWGKGVG